MRDLSIDMNKLVMVAFGGNALLRAGQKGTFEEQLENVENACSGLVPLIKAGYHIVIGHGNGPQVGNELLRQEAGSKVYGLPVMPMDYCGAETQGGIAYLLETGLQRALRRAGMDRPVVSVVTRVVVSADDPAFQNPTKPVGPYYKEMPGQAGHDGETAGQDGATYREDPGGRGWRKVVASPKPLEVSNIGIVESLARQGNIVITVGGGGIPVLKDGKGVEAVIDKDLASALAAVKMKASEFHIFTDVPYVCINFHKPGEKALETMTVAEARQYLEEGQFTEGSMAPKVRAALYFMENGGEACNISNTRIIP